jgi:hypothetical protein
MVIREQYLHILKGFKDTEFIKVITGVRRSGKSYIMRMFQDYLANEGIAVFNQAKFPEKIVKIPCLILGKFNSFFFHQCIFHTVAFSFK